MAANYHKWRYIFIESGKTGNETPFAERNELMQADHTANPCPGFNLAVSAYLGAIAKHDIVFEY